MLIMRIAGEAFRLSFSKKSGEELAKVERNFLQSGETLDIVSNFRNTIRSRFIAVSPIIK